MVLKKTAETTEITEITEITETAETTETTETTETQRRRDAEITETTEKDDSRLRCCPFRLFRLFRHFRIFRITLRTPAHYPSPPKGANTKTSGPPRGAGRNSIKAFYGLETESCIVNQHTVVLTIERLYLDC